MNPQSRPGLDEDQLRLYRHLLRTPPAVLDDHAAALGWTVRHAQVVLRDLERLELARRAPDGSVRVDDPRATLGRLLDAQEAELDARRRELLTLRESLVSFEHDYRKGLELSGPRQPPWEQVEADQATPRVDHLYRTSEGAVLQVVRQVEIGPGHHESVRRQRDAVLSSGRALRTIMPLSMLADPHWHGFAQELTQLGEQLRFLPRDEIVVEFAVFGSSAVLLDEGSGPDADWLLMRSPPVISSYVAFFEELWRRAEPILAAGRSEQDVKLLEYLALGFKDEALARQLGLSLRTVRRRIAALMAEHGVDTRFQLGMSASSRGLVKRGR